MGLFSRKPEDFVEIPIDVSSYEDSIYGRADALLDCLRGSYARPDDVGRPFGSGSDLDVVAGWVRQIAPDPLEYRPIGQRAADGLIQGIRAGDVNLDFIMQSLGVTTSAMAPLRRSDRANIGFTYDTFCPLLAAISKMDMNGMSRWLEDDAFAIQMTAYMLVAILRVQAAGVSLAY